jgi:hypothetical protein
MLFSVTSRTGYLYELSIELDNAHFEDNAFAINILAMCHPPERFRADNYEPAIVPAQVEIRPLEGMALVRIGKEVLEINLSELAAGLPDGPSDLDPMDFLPEAAGRLASWVDRSLELLDAVPAGDPFLGCLIKGGITASLGQAVRCYRDARAGQDEAAEESLLRTMFRCMRQNGLKILGNAATRAAKCAVTLGVF